MISQGHCPKCNALKSIHSIGHVGMKSLLWVWGSQDPRSVFFWYSIPVFTVEDRQEHVVHRKKFQAGFFWTTPRVVLNKKPARSVLSHPGIERPGWEKCKNHSGIVKQKSGLNLVDNRLKTGFVKQNQDGFYTFSHPGRSILGWESTDLAGFLFKTTLGVGGF